MGLLLYILYFTLGSIIGSFTNMLSYRYVYSEPIWTQQRSYCPKCRHTLKWYNLIPILSYIFQKGKCSFCKKPIHSRYFYLELFSGVLFVFLMHNIPTSYENLIFVFVLLLFLIPILIIDVMIQIIYDEYLKFLLLITLIFLYINEYYYNFDLFINIPTFKQGLIGFLVIYLGCIILNKIAGYALYGDYRFDLLGMGDVKLIGWMYMILGSYTEIMIMGFFAAVIGVVLFVSVALTSYYVNIKTKGTDVEFLLTDAVTQKNENVKVRLSPIINKKVYKQFTEKNILPHTFLVGDMDEENQLVKLQSGKISFSIKVDKETITKMKADKKNFFGEGLLIDFYVECNFIFEEGNLVGFEYNQPSDYELYMQSILRTKKIPTEGVPFAPSLIFAFLLFLMWGEKITPFVRSLFLATQ